MKYLIIYDLECGIELSIYHNQDFSEQYILEILKNTKASDGHESMALLFNSDGEVINEFYSPPPEPEPVENPVPIN